MLIGYMRVSTGEQNLDLQRDALDRAGCDRIFDDVRSTAWDVLWLNFLPQSRCYASARSRFSA